MFKGLFERGPEARGMDASAQKNASSESTQENEPSSPEANKQIMIEAIAEHIWNTGMTQGMKGTPEERKAAAREMAEEALALAPDKYMTLPTRELNDNKYHLVAEAVRLYQENTQDSSEQDAKDTLAAK